MKDKQAIERMAAFLTTGIAPDALALEFRRLKLEVVRLVLQADEDTYNKDWIVSALYYLDSVTEILDPYLESEEK